MTVAVVVKLALTWQEATYVLAAILLFLLGAYAFDEHVGEGPKYTWQENVWGMVGLAALCAAVALVIGVVAMVLP